MNIVVVDDYAKSQVATINWINKQLGLTLLFSAINGFDLLKQMNKHKVLPDIILMDIRMKPIDGCAATYFLKKQYSSIKIIAVTGFIEKEIIRQAIICGVDAYVFKPQREIFLLEAIEHVMQEQFYLDVRLTQEIDAIILSNYFKIKSIFWKKSEGVLTARESIFVALVSTELAYKEVAELMNVEEKTIQTMFARVSEKLGLKNQKELVLYCLQNGLAVNVDFSYSNIAKEVA
ncbi:MAG: response regulator transcription factor [Chitinophagaceae bacterium]|nr:response regulator transcription factor [Chitinophagaceae bacterium]